MMTEKSPLDEDVTANNIFKWLWRKKANILGGYVVGSWRRREQGGRKVGIFLNYCRYDIGSRIDGGYSIMFKT